MIQPTTLLPAARRASLIAATTDAKMGAEADVPPESVNWPFTAIAVGHLNRSLY